MLAEEYIRDTMMHLEVWSKVELYKGQDVDCRVKSGIDIERYNRGQLDSEREEGATI
jgi:hypothetical protein